MNHKFNCPHCGQRVSVSEDLVGTESYCPSCDGEILVSLEEEISLDVPPPPTVENLEDQVLRLGIDCDIPTGHAPSVDSLALLNAFFVEVRDLRSILADMEQLGKIVRAPAPEELRPVFARMFTQIVHNGESIDEAIMEDWLRLEIPQLFADA
jgi:hypothetical protein